MTEYLKATARDTSNAIEASPMMRDAWVARMNQFGAVLILLVSLINVVQFHGPHWSWGLGCAWFNCFLSVTCLSLTFTRWFVRNWRPAVFFLLTALIVSNTVIGTIGQAPMLLFLSLILLIAGTGSILPWSSGYQISFNAVCLISYAVHLGGVSVFDSDESYKILGLVTSAMLAWFSAAARNRFVGKHEETERISRESEAALRQIFDANTDCITLIELGSRLVLDVNEQFVRLSGYRRDEVVGKTTSELNLWATPGIEKEFVRRIGAGENVKNLEVTFRTKEGKIIPCLLSSVMITLHGRPCVMTLTSDIAELRESQQQLRESEATLRRIFDASLDWLSIIDLTTGDYLDVNESFARSLGRPREEIIGSNFLKLGLWPDQKEWTLFSESLIKTGEVRNQRANFLMNGVLTPCLVSAVQCELWGKLCCISTGRDITDLNEAQEKLRESEATLRRIFDASLDWMSIIDISTGEYLDVNASFADATGYRREEIIGSNFSKLGIWPDEKESRDFTDKLLLNGQVRNQRATFRMKDGILTQCLVSAVQCELWGKRCCISTARDITDLNEAQEKLRQSETTFRKVFDSSLDAMSIIDAATGCYIDVNPECVRGTGFSREEFIGKSADELSLWANPEQRESFGRALLEKGEVRNMQTENRRKDGSLLTTLTSGVIAEIGDKLCCFVVSRDISELIEGEQKLRKSEAMLRAIFDDSPDSISLLDLTTQTVVEVNGELAKSIGLLTARNDR